MADYQLSTAINLPSAGLSLDPLSTGELSVTMPADPVAPPPPPSIDSPEGQSHLAEVEAAHQEIIDRVAAKPPDPVSPAPSETFSLEMPNYNLFSIPSLFTPFEEQFKAGASWVAGSNLSQSFTTSKSDLAAQNQGATGQNILPEVLGDAAKEILKNVGITALLAILGYKIAGWKGALAGALVWIGPNIPAALAAKAATEKALGA